MSLDRTAVAAQLAVAPDAAQQMLAGHPVPLRRAGEPFRYAAFGVGGRSGTIRVLS
jgi:hypothetical protein